MYEDGWSEGGVRSEVSDVAVKELASGIPLKKCIVNLSHRLTSESEYLELLAGKEPLFRLPSSRLLSCGPTSASVPRSVTNQHKTSKIYFCQLHLTLITTTSSLPAMETCS